MNKFYPVLQIISGAILALIAIVTAINLLLITTRPETISVVNAMIGQGVIIIAMVALSRILFRKGLQGLRAARQEQAEGE